MNLPPKFSPPTTHASLAENKTTVGTRATPHITTLGAAAHLRPLQKTGVAQGESSALVDGTALHNLPDGKLASFGN